MNNTSDNYTGPINQRKYYQDYLIREKKYIRKEYKLKDNLQFKEKEKENEGTIPRQDKIIKTI